MEIIISTTIPNIRVQYKLFYDKSSVNYKFNEKKVTKIFSYRFFFKYSPVRSRLQWKQSSVKNISWYSFGE